MNLKYSLDNLKSKFILQRIFNNLSKRQLLKIIKYNKMIQSKLNIDNNSYKKFSELYTTIEIEMNPVSDIYGKFINKIKKEDESYYHIYFNDNKEEEIKRNIIKEEDKVTKIDIIINYQVKSFEDLFSNCKCIEYLHFKKCCRNNINNMSGMFFNCSSLKGINLLNLKTNNVTNMRIECSIIALH